jgi:hypothetical protein
VPYTYYADGGVSAYYVWHEWGRLSWGHQMIPIEPAP